jgi:sugar lactone lactonase YvrE
MNRWQAYAGPVADVAAGWRFEPIVGPARLWGANGIVQAGRDLYVTQVFGSQVTAIDIDTGAHRVWSGIGTGIAAPDDGVFLLDGSFVATEPMNATVSVRNPDGSYRTLVDDLPGINGITTDRSRRRLFADEFRPGGRLWELDPSGERPPRLLLDELVTPNALAVGPDDALWFPQVAAGEIWRYDLGTGTSRKAFDGLAAPVAVKFDSAGRLLTPESAAGVVTRIDLATGRREPVAAVGRGIDNIALSADDRLFVSHFVDGRVSEGADRILSPGGLLGPYGLAVLADRRIAAADGLSLAVVGRDGAIERTHVLLADLPGLAVAVGTIDGVPVVAVAHGMLLTCRAGRVAEPLASGLGGPIALCPLPDGTVAVVERDAGCVSRVERNGTTTPLVHGLDRPVAASLGPDGTWWVAAADAVVAVRDGAVTARVPELAGARGIAAGASGVVVAHVPSGRLVHLDAGTRRARTIVADAPISPPVAGASLPHASAPVAVDGDGFLVGCIGDGTLRRLVAG